MTVQAKEFKPTVFKTSRQMDFFSESELVTQTGHAVDEWPLVFLKEAIDNALDACEEHGVQPTVLVVADESGISVQDNGPGIPESTVEGVLDFSVRASSREAYVTPTRGAQGNALMSLVGMPFVLSGGAGALMISSDGVTRRIGVRADALTQCPEISVDRSGYDGGGTTIKLAWSEWPFDDDPWETGSVYDRTIQDHVFELLRGYTLFNPHLDLQVDWFGRQERYVPTSARFTKWKPSQPSSAHWYTPQQLGRLIGAYVAHDQQSGRDRTVSDFLTAFDSLTGTAKRKKILKATGLHRVNLSSLANGDGLDDTRISSLLEAMQAETKPVKPPRLGLFGKHHAVERFVDWGCKRESVSYSKVADFDDEGLPVTMEVCFGVLEKSLTDVGFERRRTLLVGANFSAAIKNPFREFGSSGQGLEGALAQARADMRQAVIFAAHISRPVVPYTDRGKSAIAL